MSRRDAFYARRIAEENGLDLRIRNSNIFDLTNLVVHIIGCGAIGSFTANALARMNVNKFQLYDMDTVGSENIGVQDFTVFQLGSLKVDAVTQNIKSINPLAVIRTQSHKVDSNYTFLNLYNSRDRVKQEVFIMALDSMEARNDVATAIDKYVKQKREYIDMLVLDPRMGSETFQLNAFKKFKLEDYKKTWYSDEEGDSEPCSARSTAYTALMAGSMISSEIKKHYTKGLSADSILFNFPSLSLVSETDYSVLKK